VEDYAGNAAETDPVSQELAPPELTAVNVQLTPLTSSNSMLLSVTTVDQYGMDYPINTNPTNGLPNVTFQVYEDGLPADYTLYDLDAQANLTSTTFTGVSNRTFNVTYRPSEPCITFKVRAEATNWISSEVSETVHGDSAAAKIDRGKPPLPGNVRALSTEITMNSITVRWDSVTDGCTSVAYYKIYGKRVDAPSYALLSQPTGLVYTQSNLTAGTSYRYYITAVDSVGLESNVTDPAAISIQATTLIDITPPTVPTGLTAVYISGNTQIQISWGASTDSDTGVHYYEIQKKMGEEELFETVQTINHPTLTWVHDQSYPGYPIYFRVRAVDNVGNSSDWSITATADVGGDRTPPSVPTNVQGQALSTTSIRVTWNASTDNTGGSGLRSYKIYRNYGTTSIAEVTATSYTNSGLTPNTEYTYQVTAVDNAGNESAKSSAVAVQTQQDPTLIQPNPPQSLHTTSKTPNSIALAWTAPVENGAVIAQYVVYKHTSATSPVGSGLAVAVVTSLSTVLTNLTPSTTYYFTVTAVSNRSVESEHSNRLATSTPDLAPTSPTNVHASNVSANWVDLSWNASVPPPGSTIDFYGVFFAEPSPFGGYNYTRISNTGQTTYRVSGLTENQTYKFSIRAYDTVGRPSTYTEPVPVLTQQGDEEAPPVPGNLNATPLNAYSIRVTWDAVTDTGGSGLAGYELYRNGSLLTTTTATFFVDGDLQPLTTYSYTVLAKDNADNKSAQSAPVQAVTYGLTDDLLCPHIANTDAWKTQLSLVNIGDSDNPVYFYALNADGQLLETSTLETLPPAACLDVDVSELFSESTFTQDIWVKISSASDLKGVVVFGTRDDQTLVTIPMFTRGAQDLIFPYVYSSDLYYTGVTLINTGAESAMPMLTAFDEAGGYLTSASVVIPAGGKFVRLVENIFNYADPNQIRFVKVDSSKPLIGFELFGSFEYMGLAGLPAFSPTVELFKTTSKSATGNDLKNYPLTRPITPTGFEGAAVSSSDIYLSWNPNPEPDIDHYAVYNNDGPVPNLIATTASTNYTVTGLQPLSTHRYSLKAVNQSSEESAATSQVRVTTLDAGQQDYPYRAYYNEIPDTDFYSVGITFSNLGTASTTVHLELFDANGNKLAEAESPAAVLEQKTRLIENFFNNQLPAGAAYLKVGAMEKLMGFELFYTADAGQNPYQFDGVIAASSGATRLYFPLVKSAAEWNTSLRLTNLTGVSNNVTVHAFDINGVDQGTYAVALNPNGKLDMNLAAMFPTTVNEIAWMYVDSDDQVIGDLFYVSLDLTKLSAYVGLSVSAE
jgi:fibronectin type 3 domain-containing protein